MHTEFQVLFLSEHRHLCKMHYFFSSDERFYFVMPLICGGDLSHHLKIKKTFAEDDIKFYIYQLMLGLSHLH